LLNFINSTDEENPNLCHLRLSYSVVTGRKQAAKLQKDNQTITPYKCQSDSTRKESRFILIACELDRK